MMLDLHGPNYITEVVLIVVCVCCATSYIIYIVHDSLIGAWANFRMTSGGLVDFIVRLVSLRNGGNLLFVWSSE